jgi:hypothetical protein
VVWLLDSTNKTDDGNRIRMHAMAAHRDFLQCGHAYWSLFFFVLHHMIGSHRKTIKSAGVEYEAEAAGQKMISVIDGKHTYYMMRVLAHPDDPERPYTKDAHGGVTRRALIDAGVHRTFMTGGLFLQLLSHF